MSRNRYVRDYRLVETVDERGRIKSDYEYIGAPYRFAGEKAAVARVKRLALALCPVLWLLYLGAMLPQSFAMRTIWVSLPFVFTAPALGVMTDIICSVCLAKEPMEHRFADKLNNRLPPAALAGAFLSGAALLGQLVRLLLGGDRRGGDWVFLVCAALLCGGCLAAFGLRKPLAVKEA